MDRLDMHQCFPGREDGLPTERLAARLFGAMAPGADVVVNLHTLGTPFDSKPYAVYKVHPDAGVAEQRLLDMIACFAPNMACRMPVTAAGGELPGNIAGALDYQCLAMGKAAFMIELGGEVARNRSTSRRARGACAGCAACSASCRLVRAWPFPSCVA